MPELDGLRAIAVWAVVFYHIGVPSVPGAYGVTLFFVLSGFLITLLLLREFGATGSVNFKAFFIRRTLRIMPAFYGYLAFCVAWKLVRGNPVNWPHLSAAATYTVNYYNAFLGDPNSGFSHAWSLAVEEQFYLIWPFAFLALVSRSILGRSLIALITSVIIVRIALKLYAPIPQSYFYSALEMRADSLLLGAGLAVIWTRFECIATECVRRFGAHWAIAASVIGVGTLATFELRLGHQFRDTFTASILPFFLSVIVIASVVRGKYGEATWLTSPVMVWLGRLSYSTYLYQQMVPGWGARLLPSSHRSFQWSVEVICVLILASGSFYIIERPALRLKERLSLPQPSRN